MKNKDAQEILNIAKELLGERIKEKRKRNKLSQGELCKLANVSRATLTRIENGSGAHLDHYINLAAALNTQLATLLKSI